LQTNPLPECDESQPKKRGRTAKSPLRKLLEQLKEDVLAFMYDFKVLFDNNQAKRDLWKMKVKMKISGGFQSNQGVEMFYAVHAYLSTARKNAQSMLDVLRMVFSEKPYCPRFASLPG